ncbi:MAG: RNB domain-containing ribonuclease [Gemmatimonadetes bacterium]|nr:RNB domain-containing ribonuclease [Gemmatimonadota bacterium]
MTRRASIQEAFQRIRTELEIRGEFPPEVLSAADSAVATAHWRDEPDRVDMEALPFVTIDPVGSRDLDQALYTERQGPGFRVYYAIADVACFVERGGPVEAEAWLRGLTYYSPDRRDPLYPPAISQEAGSLLADQARPAVLFVLDLDSRGELIASTVGRARIRSRAQLAYPEALEHIEGGVLFAAQPYSESLLLLREVGELRLARELERGGVSLPIVDQHVHQQAALRLGYELQYENPNLAEEWNAQISLLAGHAAAARMLAGGVGLLRTAPAPAQDDVARLRTAAAALGVGWPESRSYAEFLHSVPLDHPLLPVVVWQARHLMKGADYVSFDGALPEHREHAALAMVYAHATAPLRRLADRYVLDLLVQLERGDTPPQKDRETLALLPRVMDAAERKTGQLERRIIDVAEAWELRERVDTTLTAVLLDVRTEWAEVQIADPPIRARIPRAQDSPELTLGSMVQVSVLGTSVEEGRVELNFEV